MKIMTPSAFSILFALSLVALVSADRGLQITQHVTIGSWPTTTSTSPTNSFFIQDQGENNFVGIYAAETQGSNTYYQTTQGIYRTQVNSISSTPTITKGSLFGSTPDQTLDGRIRFSANRAYSFRDRRVYAWSPSSNGNYAENPPTTNSLYTNSMITDIYILEDSSPYVTLMATSTSPTSTTTWAAYCRDRGSFWTCSSLRTLTTETRCFTIFSDLPAQKALIACSGTLLVTDLDTGGSSRGIAWDSYTSYPCGAGDLVTGVYRQPLKRLYLGSALGLAFEIETNTFSLLRVTLVISGSSLSPFRSVLLDEPAGSPGVLYWGTTEGAIARVNIRDFDVFSSTALGSAADMRSLYSGNVANYFFMAGAPIDTGTTPLNSFQNFKISKTDCSLYSCGTCLANPTDTDYCGWCLSSGTCTTSGTCASGWSQATGICPAPVSLSPNRGAATGQTTVVYTGTYFIASEPGNFYCKWGSNPSVVATAVTATTVTCVSPAMSGTQSLSINYRTSAIPERQWSAPIPFSFYDCATVGSSCSTCQDNAYPECGWCFRSASCTSQRACPNTATFEWQQTTCPAVSTISPTTGTSLDFPTSQSSISLRVQTQNWPSSLSGFNMLCAFSGSSLTSPGSYASGVVTCPVPTLPSSGSTYYSIAIKSATGGQPLLTAAYTTNSFEIYSCTGLNACYECNRHAGNCKWCVNGLTSAVSCILGTSSCSSGFTETPACATATGFSPTTISMTAVATAPNAVFTGIGLDSTSADLTMCYFSYGPTIELKTSISSKTATNARCPYPSGLFAGDWLVALGNVDFRQTAQFPLQIYDCTLQYSCGECLTTTLPNCDWCLNVGGAGCQDSSHSVSCSAGWLTQRGVCPALNSAFPLILPESGGTLLLSGNHYLSAANVSQVRCKFANGLSADKIAVATMNGTNVQCTAPATTNEYGPVQVSLVPASNTSAIYATATTITVARCSQLSDCESCLSGQDFCSWCGATCSDTCPPDQTAHVCPTVTSVEPLFSHMGGGERITITGTGFLTSSAKRDVSDQSGELSKTEAIAVAFGAKKKRFTSASPYQCDFGGILVQADVDSSGTHIYCTTPLKAAIGPSIMNVLYQGSLYLSTPGITYFRCDESPSDVCEFSCTSYEHCGWCVSNNTCSSLSQCQALSGTLDPIWQTEQCPTADLSLEMAPTKGDIPLVATLTSLMPSSVVQSELSCDFGNVGLTPVDSLTTVQVTDADGNTTSVSQVSCVIPPTASAMQTQFSLMWRAHKYMKGVAFEYGDCGLYKECTKCLSISFCGWCSKGNKCTMSIECPSDSWKKNKCPINKVAIGVGVGLGSFAFLLLLLLLLFLVRRLRKNSGLVIALKEPNYAEIAWGTDTSLMWKVPSDNYQKLENHLRRRDFLLQVAISFNCPATEQDALAKALVNVASVHGLAAEMIQTCIRYEVASCLSENTLFRNNSVASKMYKFFSRIVGIKYLFNCIARVIMELEILGRRQAAATESAADGTSPRNVDVSLLSMTMELDQTKVLEDDIDTETNLLQLQLICQKMLNVLIKTSVQNLPSSFRKIFIEIDNSVMNRFAGSNDAVYKGIGGLYFLRFVCPAITAPHVYGLLETPPNTVTQRQLVLISKVIQNIANMQPPGKKEEYMVVLSDFIVQSIPKIIKFYDNLRQAVNLTSNGEVDQQDLPVPEEVRLNGLAATWNFLHTDKNKIRTWMDSLDCPIDQMQKDDLNNILTECENEYPNAPKKMKSVDPNDEGKKKKK